MQTFRQREQVGIIAPKLPFYPLKHTHFFTTSCTSF